MRFSGSERDEQGPWFTLGKVEVTTTILVLLVWAVTLLVYIADRYWMVNLALIPDDITSSGEVWRIVTWPFAHIQFGLGEIIGAVIFGLFGTYLEMEVGRRPFAILLGASTLIISFAAIVWSLILGEQTGIADLALLELTVVLLYIAEHPTRPFFFNIPAWVIAAVIVALEVVNDLADREWVKLLTIIVASGLIALVARKIGLLSMYDRVPDVSLPSRKRRGDSSPLRDARSTGGATAAPAREPKPRGPLWGKRGSEEAEIVPMPTAPRRRPPAATSVPDVSADDLALDLLLDKISDGGMDSLTDAERRELDELRARRRGA